MKTIYGVGINDADYVISPTVNGKRVRCMFYQTWANMLKRCYCEKSRLNDPYYEGCSVDERWHRFMTFRKWMSNQNWEGNQLDKDILVQGNRIYSPETCIFISPVVNTFIARKNVKTQGVLKGVRWNKRDKRFIASCSNGINDVHLGSFLKIEDAQQAYVEFKKSVVLDLIAKQTNPTIAIGLSRIFSDVIK